MTQIVWLTDVHYMTEGGINDHDPRQRLDAAVARISADFSTADLVLISGDLTEHGRPADYAALASVLGRLPIPVACLMGNHDNRDHMAEALPPPTGAQDGFRQFCLSLGEDRLICLDTTVDQAASGGFCAARFAWLDQALAAAEGRRVIVAMHHPPVPLCLPLQDADRVAEGDALMARLAEHGNVAQILCGHVHRPVQSSAFGIPVMAMSAVAYQAPPPWPPWTWDTFDPPHEPPSFGVVTLTAEAVAIHAVQFCAAADGLASRA